MTPEETVIAAIDDVALTDLEDVNKKLFDNLKSEILEAMENAREEERRRQH